MLMEIKVTSDLNTNQQSPQLVRVMLIFQPYISSQRRGMKLREHGKSVRLLEARPSATIYLSQ